MVIELTSFCTRIPLDSGRELTLLNARVLTGSLTMGKVGEAVADMYD
jgi:hypothetical protein